MAPDYGKQQPWPLITVSSNRTPESPLRGHSLENRPDIRIFFSLILAVLIRIVQPTSKFRKFIRIIGNHLGKKSEKNQKSCCHFVKWVRKISTSSSGKTKLNFRCFSCVLNLHTKSPQLCGIIRQFWTFTSKLNQKSKSYPYCLWKGPARPRLTLSGLWEWRYPGCLLYPDYGERHLGQNLRFLSGFIPNLSPNSKFLSGL